MTLTWLGMITCRVLTCKLPSMRARRTAAARGCSAAASATRAWRGCGTLHGGTLHAPCICSRLLPSRRSYHAACMPAPLPPSRLLTPSAPALPPRRVTWPSSIDTYSAAFAAGLKVLVFSGDGDATTCPFSGTQVAIDALSELPGAGVTSNWTAWNVNGQKAGYIERHGEAFTFATVRGAGHEAPGFMPYATYELVSNFIAGTLEALTVPPPPPPPAARARARRETQSSILNRHVNEALARMRSERGGGALPVSVTTTAPAPHMPVFSWATVPVFLHTSSASEAVFNAADLAIAARFPAVTIEKWQGCAIPDGPTQEEATLATAAAIKALAPQTAVFIWYDSLRVYANKTLNPDIIDKVNQTCVRNAHTPFLEAHRAYLLPNVSGLPALESYIHARESQRGKGGKGGRPIRTRYTHFHPHAPLPQPPPSLCAASSPPSLPHHRPPSTPRRRVRPPLRCRARLLARRVREPYAHGPH